MIDEIIPEGWTKEVPCGDETGEVLVVSTPEKCHVTIDFKHRQWALGYGVTFLHIAGGSSNGKKYSGRNWRKEIVQDAVSALKSV
jgi:hypothetical protein